MLLKSSNVQKGTNYYKDWLAMISNLKKVMRIVLVWHTFQYTLKLMDLPNKDAVPPLAMTGKRWVNQ